MGKILAIFLLFFSVSAGAQKGLSKTDLAYLQKLEEDSIKPYAKQMVFDTIPGRRFLADSAFIRQFVKALRVPHSFDYLFDSVITISKLYPPDSSFRIFTWELQRDEDYYRQQGAIQMRTADGSLKLFPLADKSEFATSPADSARGIQNWIGAIYYNIITKEYKGKKYYTLIGIDDNDIISTRKWIDVLTFDANGQPRFGGNIFDYKDDSLKLPQPVYRFLLEFKKDAKARMSYDPELDMIVFDHLISESNEQAKKFTLVPDGTYEGFKWKNGKWVHVDDIFAGMPVDNKTPVPQPLYDNEGKPAGKP